MPTPELSLPFSQPPVFGPQPALATPARPAGAPTTQTAQAALSEGTALGVWRLGAALHAGGGGRSGQWFRAQHALAADRASVVLVLPRNERSSGVLLRFGDQVGELGQLRHPAITVPTDSGVTAAGQPYLILDWTDGQPILSACAPLPLRERLLLLVQLCELLRSAHQQGWLLGEMDPAMLWVDADQHLTLMGLGLVPMPDPADPFERGTSLGTTPGYMSLELMAGAPPSLSSEVYGLGALLCMLVDGRLPSERGAGVHDVSRAAAWPCLSALEQLSLDALLHKAASPLIAQRHASAEALADDLRAWLAGANHSALALTPMPAPAPVSPPSPPLNSARRASPAGSRNAKPAARSSGNGVAWDGQRAAWPATPTAATRRQRRRLAALAFALAALLGAASWANLALWPEPGAPGLNSSPSVALRPLLARPEARPTLPSVLPSEVATTTVGAPLAEPSKFRPPPAISSKLTEDATRGIDPLPPLPVGSKDDPLSPPVARPAGPPQR